MTPKYSAALFDLDDTIFDHQAVGSKKPSREFFSYAVARAGFSVRRNNAE